MRLGLLGWFYLIDPRPYHTAPLPLITSDAQANQTFYGWNDADTTPTMSSWIFTDPYAVTFADRRIDVMDTSYNHDDYGKPPEPAAVLRYPDHFAKVEALADAVGAPAWLVTHRPFWAVASYPSGGQPQAGASDATLQAAIEIHGEGRLSAATDLLLAGHIHLFEAIRFRDGRPVAGRSETAARSAPRNCSRGRPCRRARRMPCVAALPSRRSSSGSTFSTSACFPPVRSGWMCRCTTSITR